MTTVTESSGAYLPLTSERQDRSDRTALHFLHENQGAFPQPDNERIGGAAIQHDGRIVAPPVSHGSAARAEVALELDGAKLALTHPRTHR